MNDVSHSDMLVHPSSIPASSYVSASSSLCSYPVPVVPSFSSKGVAGSFSGPLRFFSCPFSSKDGLRCPRGSFVHAPFCRFHLRERLNLDILNSTISGAGRGLFSLIPRLKGDHLVDYVGECLNASELEQRYPKENVGIFALALSSSCFIDAALFRGVLMLMRPVSTSNLMFVLSSTHAHVLLAWKSLVVSKLEARFLYPMVLTIGNSLTSPLTTPLMSRFGSGIRLILSLFLLSPLLALPRFLANLFLPSTSRIPVWMLNVLFAFHLVLIMTVRCLTLNQ